MQFEIKVKISGHVHRKTIRSRVNNRAHAGDFGRAVALPKSPREYHDSAVLTAATK